MSVTAPGLVLASIVGLVSSGCLRSSVRQCDDGSICPAGLRCARMTEGEICLPEHCGDGHADPGELCDDGNNLSGDGCSADCLHLEQCGNGVQDPGEACDDGNLQSQDGCSSRCGIESPSWTTIEGAPDPGRGSMAYDAARGLIVLLDASHNTWEWDGAHWQRRTPRTVPRSVFYQFITPMYYDPARQRVVLFSDGVWEWDGADWAERPGLAVPSLAETVIVHDPVRHTFVMVGINYIDGETWESDGTTWRQVTTAPIGHAVAFDSRIGKLVQYIGNGEPPIPNPDTRPGGDFWLYEHPAMVDGQRWSPRQQLGGPRSYSAEMAYDAGRGQFVIFAALYDTFFNQFTETWTWDRVRWDKRVAGSGPELRTWAAMAYDVARRQLVLFGGQRYLPTVNLFFDDTWVWSGVDWQPPEATTPPARSHHAMIYDAGRASGVLFGGHDADARCLGDTWLWNGFAWRVAGAGPPPRAEHAMAYDAARDRTVLFGGSDAGGQLVADTWEWDGTLWQDHSTERGPAARRGHAMVYDTARRQLLMFGGSAQNSLLSDQWIWTGTEWVDATPVAGPPARADTALAYDLQRACVVLFGGRGESGLLNDVWEWDGTQWSDRTPADLLGPAARAGHTLLYDPALRRVVLFGGNDGSETLNDTWTWDGARWTEVIAAAAPPREHHAMMYDPLRRQIVMFAGDAPAVKGDVWFWRYRDDTTPDESCDTGFDGDGDGKIGCDDPDCSMRCTECGDGVCAALENCRLCPSDCGTCNVCGDLVCDPSETCSSCPGDCGECARQEGSEP